MHGMCSRAVFDVCVEFLRKLQARIVPGERGGFGVRCVPGRKLLLDGRALGGIGPVRGGPVLGCLGQRLLGLPRGELLRLGWAQRGDRPVRGWPLCSKLGDCMHCL